MPRERSPDRVRLSTTVNKRTAKLLGAIAREMNVDKSRALDFLVADFDRARAERKQAQETTDWIYKEGRFLPMLERK